MKLRRDTWWEATSLVSCVTVLLFWVGALCSSTVSLLAVLGGVLGASLLADFGSGVVHWTFDTWGSERWPVVGRVFVRPFREHHMIPSAITTHGPCELLGASALVMLPVLVLAWWLVARTSMMFESVLVGTTAVLMVLTNLFHKWAHGTAPRWARVLQRLGIVVGPDHHVEHHERPFLTCYCITNGWCNAALDRLRFFRGLEWLVTKISGATPRQEDGTLDQAADDESDGEENLAGTRSYGVENENASR